MKPKYASLTADLIKRVPARIIGPDGGMIDVTAFVQGRQEARVCDACGTRLA